MTFVLLALTACLPELSVSPETTDCDGNPDDSDLDGDGYAGCEECDDDDPSINPEATETCDGVDNDCDGDTDEDDALDVSTWYIDTDGDGYGVSDTTTEACSMPSGYSASDDDCDDDDSSINPGASESCNGEDDDCDGSIDESFVDTDSDGTANCVDDCPVYADPSQTSNGDGSESDPYMSINDAISLRGTYCDQIVLKEGTYSEQVDYGGEDLDISAEKRADKTIIDGSSASGSVVTFADGESASAVLEGVTITGGNGTTGDGSSLGDSYSLGTSQRHGGGVYIYDADPTITDCIIEDNTVSGFGGGVMAYTYEGTFEGNTVDGNEAQAANYAGAGLFLYDSDATITDNEITDNEASGSSGDGAGAMVRYSDAVRFYEADGLFANNVVIDHAHYALGLTDGSDIDIVNNTIDGNGVGLLVLYNTTGYPGGDVVDNLITNSDYYGIYASYYPCTSLGSISYNDVYDSGYSDWSSSYCESYWSSSGNVEMDPKYEDRSKGDYDLQKDSPIKDSGTDTDSYGVDDDYEGETRTSGSYSMGAYERD